VPRGAHAARIPNCLAMEGVGSKAHLACRLRSIGTISIPERIISTVFVDLKPSYGPDAALDAPMIQFNAVVEILALADSDRPQCSSRWISQAVFKIAGSDGVVIGLAAVDDDTFRPAMTLQDLPQEALGRRQVTIFIEREFDPIAKAADGAIRIHPLAANLDVGLVHVPLSNDAPLVPFVSVQQPKREAHDATMHS
jgi:hypothetical protein